MIYENEFRRLKELRDALSPAAREIAGGLALMPVACVALYGGLMGGLGIVGLGGVIAIGAVATAGTVAAIAYTIDLEQELGPWLQRQAARADARAIAKGLRLKKKMDARLREAFGKTFAEAAAPVVAVAQAPVAAATPAPLHLSGAAFNPVAARMLSVANSDAAAKPAKPLKSTARSGGGGKAKA